MQLSLWWQRHRSGWGISRARLGVLGLVLLLVSCQEGADIDDLSPPPAGTPVEIQVAVHNLLTQYRTALVQEDIDRLQAILPSAAVTSQGSVGQQSLLRSPDGRQFVDTEHFRDTIADDFRRHVILNVQITDPEFQTATEPFQITFLQGESLEEPGTLAQHTRAWRVTFGLTREEHGGVITFRIGAVWRDGPLVQASTLGQVVAEGLTRLHIFPGTVSLSGGEIIVPETRAVHPLVAVNDQFHGLFVPPVHTHPQPLHIRLQTGNGGDLVIAHHYRLRLPSEPVIQPVLVDTAPGRPLPCFFAVATTLDGTVWAGANGGDATQPDCAPGAEAVGGARLYRVLPDNHRAQFVTDFTEDPLGQVDDLVVDALGRLHVLVHAVGADGFEAVSQDIVHDPAYPRLFCRTVNAFDPNQAYPFTTPTRPLEPSPSTRVAAAAGGSIWLFGSDGGLAQVADTFRNGQCGEKMVQVRYAPVLRRQDSALLSNTVPALVVGAHDTLWVGSALGLQRLQNGQWTSIPFQRGRSFRGNVETLESLFTALAEAILAAQPLTTERLGTVSFVDQFGSEVVKGDLVLSAVEDSPGRLWVGTLGEGLRRIEARAGTFQDTLQLTQAEVVRVEAEGVRTVVGQPGIGSNVIFALAVGRQGSIWAATDSGVSRIVAGEGTVALTTFGALDGLALPVRDVAVDTAGTVWVATAGGLFRLLAHGGRIAGVVQDPAGQPLAGVDVRVQGTPFRAVTDAAGHYVLATLPPGEYVLVFESQFVPEGPFTRQTLSNVEVRSGESQTLAPVTLVPTPLLSAHAGNGAQVIVNTTLPLVALLADRFGAVAGVPVTFRLTAGQGSVTPESVLTGPDGQATTMLTVGTAAGTLTVEASVVGLSPVVFTVLATADQATARLVIVSGNDQVGFPGQVLREPLVVRLIDAFSNPIVGQEIRAQLIEGAGIFVDPPQAQVTPRPGVLSAPAHGAVTRIESTNPEGEARFSLRVEALIGIVDVSTVVPGLPEAGEELFRVNIARIATGSNPRAVALGDVNGDGRLDVITANTGSNDVSVLQGQGDGTFVDEQRFPAGTAPHAVVLGDVNGDSRLDIITANRDSNDVSVLLGQGDGTFVDEQRFPVGLAPHAVVLGHVNGDSRLDIITANRDSNDISVLRGQGNGTFVDEQRFPVGLAPHAVVLGHVNGDSRLDIITANRDSNDISVLRGQGNGTFVDEQRFPVGLFPEAVLLGDINGDGHLDVLTANPGSNDISVLRGQGNGTFVDEQRFIAGAFSGAMALGDVNGDGRLDVLMANFFSTDVSVLLGRENGTLATEQRFQVSSRPTAIALGDVNGDGRLDVLTANALSADISVLLGRGNGTLATQQRIATGSNPRAVALGDVNGDGRLDVLTANAGSNDISVLLSRGSGTLATQRRFAVGDAPAALALDDVNGDGRLDVLTANADTDDVSVLLGRGDGVFADEQRFVVGTLPQAVALGDVNGDSHLDLVTANTNSSDVSVLLGQGNGTFVDEQRLQAGTRPQAVALGDMNGDGRLDLVVANHGSADVAVLLGQGNGTFAASQRFAVNTRLLAVALGDVNGDGHLDVLTANADTNDVAVLPGRGDGTLATPQRFTVGIRPQAVTLGDVNDDGHLDVVTANHDSADVSVLLGQRNGTLAAQQRFTTGTQPQAVALGDVNGDGHLDVLTASAANNDVSVLLGQGNGTLAAQQRFTTGTQPQAVALGDVNGDGRLDVLTVNALSADVSVLLGQGNGTLAAQQRFAVGTLPQAVVLGDVNGDGRLDLATANTGSDDASVLLGQGDGTFADEQHIAMGFFPVAVALGDLNGDGRLDLVTANSSGGIAVRRGGGDGTFAAPQRFQAGDLPTAVTLRDVNGDGRLDVITANRRSNDISVLLGQGDGTFAAQQRFQVGTVPVSLALGDLNGDGRLDLVTANAGSNDVTVLRGQGDGTFVALHLFHLDVSPNMVTLGDVNGDGHLDVLTANTGSDDISVLLGQGDGTLPSQQRFQVGSRPTAVALGDLNGDGRLDLVTANSGFSDVSVLRGRGDGSFGLFGGAF